MTEHEKLVEELARVIDPVVWQEDTPVPTRADVIAFHARRQSSCSLARATLELIAAKLYSPTIAMTDAGRRVPAKSPKSAVWNTMLAFSPLYPEDRP